MSKHLFALYIEDLSRLLSHTTIQSPSELPTKELAQRIYSVLRLQPGDNVVLFDGMLVVDFLVQASSRPRKILCGQVIAVTKITRPIGLLRKIILPLLKKDALEQAIYSASATGIDEIIVATSEKSRQKQLTEKERSRLDKIIIAACEQAKNYTLPKLTLHNSSVRELISHSSNLGLVLLCSPNGAPLKNIINTVTQEHTVITALIGPEAGFTNQEMKFFLDQKQIFPVKLTKTILRSTECTTLISGLITSL